VEAESKLRKVGAWFVIDACLLENVCGVHRDYKN